MLKLIFYLFGGAPKHSFTDNYLTDQVKKYFIGVAPKMP